MVSTVVVRDQIAPSRSVEDADARVMSPTRKIDGSYANGYGSSKWGGEVLLREPTTRAASLLRCCATPGSWPTPGRRVG